MKQILFFLIIPVLCIACSSPSKSPDKTIAGATLGSGWGSGVGAVVGNQVGNAASGVPVGAGFGFVAGALTGVGYDSIESDMAAYEEELEALRAQNVRNGRKIREIDTELDRANSSTGGSFYQVYFDPDETSLKAGSIANLQAYADNLKRISTSERIYVIGHSDDSGLPDYNTRISESRAREVSGYLMGRGISADQIIVKSHGSARPIASNASPEGRQLNRRVDIYVASVEIIRARQ